MEHKEDKKLDGFIRGKLAPPFNIEYNEAHFEEAMAMLSSANTSKLNKWRFLKLGAVGLLIASLVLTYHLCSYKPSASHELPNKQQEASSNTVGLTTSHSGLTTNASPTASIPQTSAIESDLSTTSINSDQTHSVISSKSSNNTNSLPSISPESKGGFIKSIPSNDLPETSKTPAIQPIIQPIKGVNSVKIQPSISNEKYAQNAVIPLKKDSLFGVNSTTNAQRPFAQNSNPPINNTVTNNNIRLNDSVNPNVSVAKTDAKSTSAPQIVAEKTQASTMPFNPSTPIDREFISIASLQPMFFAQALTPVTTNLAIVNTPIPSAPRPRPWRLELVGGINFNLFTLTSTTTNYQNTFSRRQAEESNARSSQFGLHLVHQIKNWQYTTGLNYVTQNLNTQYANQIYTNKTHTDTLHLTKEVLRYVYSYSLNRIVDTFSILVPFDSIHVTQYLATTTAPNASLLNQTIGISYAEIPFMVGYNINLTRKISLNPNMGFGLGVITSQYGSLLQNDMESFQKIESTTTILMNLLANIQLDYRLNSRWGVGFSVGSRLSLNPIIHSNSAFQWQIKALNANLHLKYNL
jgi:hypothetical protein